MSAPAAAVDIYKAQFNLHKFGLMLMALSFVLLIGSMDEVRMANVSAKALRGVALMFMLLAMVLFGITSFMSVIDQKTAVPILSM